MAAAKKQTGSIAVRSIAAINKAETILANMAKFNAEFLKTTENVETLKADLDLGFKQYEVEMEEKKAKLVADYEAKSETLSTDFSSEEATLKADLEAITESIAVAEANAERLKEELAYELKKHIERENLTAATEIAYQYGKVVVSSTLVEDLNEKVAVAETTLVESLELAAKKAETDKHSALGSQKKVHEAEDKLTLGKLEAALERADRAEETVKYLQGRMDLVPAQIADAVKAAKADIAVNNDNGRK